MVDHVLEHCLHGWCLLPMQLHHVPIAANAMELRWGISPEHERTRHERNSAATHHPLLEPEASGDIAHIRAVAGLQRASAIVAEYQQTGRHGAAQSVRRRCETSWPRSWQIAAAPVLLSSQCVCCSASRWLLHEYRASSLVDVAVQGALADRTKAI